MCLVLFHRAFVVRFSSKLPRSTVLPNHVTLASLLSACSSLRIPYSSRSEGFANWYYSLRCKGLFFYPDCRSRQQVPTVADFSAHTRSCVAFCWDRSIGVSLTIYAVFVLYRWITWNLAETKVYVDRNRHGSLWSSICLSFKPEESGKQSYEMKMVSGCESSQQLGDGSALAAHSSQCRTMIWWFGKAPSEVDSDFYWFFVDEDWSLPWHGAQPFLVTKLGVRKSQVQKQWNDETKLAKNAWNLCNS